MADLGLLKDLNHEFTKTNTELRGTRVDPALESFKDFQLIHEMYAVAWLLWFIFTGRDGIDDDTTGPVADLVRRCIHSDNSGEVPPRRSGAVPPTGVTQSFREWRLCLSKRRDTLLRTALT
ncbi:hypothetical protein DDE18_16960 [Nocardioides gansuensis]|uniref:Uncharacterized protein n=1 Tax=Nocardioides gansuensis TaxID=2138300 RepID=A0A2T8F7N2_9ACTN|nr:hypothetical protein [Nocardioides gansuensis]PVG81677.1 hypothetical protein DDE18_16960 [Nocardioides gansuensis]